MAGKGKEREADESPALRKGHKRRISK